MAGQEYIKIPDGWFDCTNVGDVIPGTQFITFKTPLKKSYFDHHRTPEDKRFTPTTLLECMRERGLNLGLVIDLTDTKRYYDKEEFTTKGVEYEKIRAKGLVPPNQRVVESFFKTVDKFLGKSEKDNLIGVHCTHGVNRTGYVICRYMMERLGMNPTDALEAYAKARGKEFDRDNYKDDLMKKARETLQTVKVENQESSRSDEGESFVSYDDQGYDAWNDLRRPPPPL